MSVTVLGTNFMEITPDPVGSNSKEVIAKAHVSSVIAVKFQQRQSGDDEWDYPFNSVTMLIFNIVDGRKIALELQTVSNQPGWNNGSLAALANAQDDVNVWLGGGSLSPSPSVLVSPSSFTFPDGLVNSFSAAQSMVVSGSNLTNNIVVTAPAGYIINTTGNNVNASPITLVQAGGTVAPTTIFIKFNPTAVQSYNGTLTVTSTGALTQNVTLTAQSQVPDVFISLSSIAFDPTEVDMYSDAQSFVVNGSGLFANLVITAPTGFIINTDGSTTNSGPISLVPLAGVVAPTTIYVRSAPLVVDQVYSGNITCASSLATTENVAVSGFGLFSQNRVYSYYHNI